MTMISRQAIVNCTPAQMYDLVNAIEDYPKFLPWCRSSEVLYRDEDQVKARLELARGGFHKSFTTHNLLQTDKMIEIRLLDGPFDHLQGLWRFNQAGEKGCQILFDLEFKLAGRVLDFAFGALFQQIANSMVDIFCQRAQELYGNPEQIA